MKAAAGVLLVLALVSGCGSGVLPAGSADTADAKSPAAAPRTPEQRKVVKNKTARKARSEAAEKVAAVRVEKAAARKRALQKAVARKAVAQKAVARRARLARATARRAKPATKAAARTQASRRFAVLDVVDGDTVRVDYRGGVSVRVIGIDTPETVSPSVPDECGGQAASAAAQQLLAGRSVSMRFDPTQDRSDRYGRPLVYLDIPGVGDFGRAMIRRGLAAEYTYDAAYQRQAGYRDAEGAARSARRGLWGTCGGPDVPLRRPRPAPLVGGSGGGCAPGYSPCVPPFPPDRNCDDVDGPVTVTGSDPHGLDSDDDGVACES